MCTCPPDEVPSVWLHEEDAATTSDAPEASYGWISRDLGEESGGMSKLHFATTSSVDDEHGTLTASNLQFLMLHTIRVD